MNRPAKHMNSLERALDLQAALNRAERRFLDARTMRDVMEAGIQLGEAKATARSLVSALDKVAA